MTTNPATVNHPALGHPETEFDRFVYLVSHDLQEPLRMVNSFVKLVNTKHAEGLPEECQEYLGYITDNASKMNQMIRSLVEYSRVERNRDAVVDINLIELINDMLTMFGPEIASNNASISIDELPIVQGQPTLILTLFRNIFQNAFENCGPDSLSLSLRVNHLPNCYQFTLKDNGCGIEPEQLDSIFEIFRKINPKSDKIGAGLAISRAIVRKHGGEIHAESTPGFGTSIIFTLPK